ncbi:MAG: hypothetical protein ACYCX4_02670 [Bacillota bacterium]
MEVFSVPCDCGFLFTFGEKPSWKIGAKCPRCGALKLIDPDPAIPEKVEQHQTDGEESEE